MLQYVRKARPLAAAVAFSVLFTACSDGGDDNGGTGPTGGFNEQTVNETTSATTAATQAFTDESDALNGATMAMVAMSGFALVSPAMPFEAAGVIRQGAVRTRIDGPRLAAPQMAGPILEDSLTGRTYVYDATSGEFVNDPSRTGAPAGKVRVIYYAYDITGQMVMPLSEQGYVDMTDVSAGATYGMRFEIFRTAGSAAQLADYTVQVAAAADTSRLEADGYFSSGTAASRVDFDLLVRDQYANNVWTSIIDFALDNASQNIEIDLDIVETENENTFAWMEEGSFQVRHNSNTTLVEWTDDDSTLDGTVRFNGTVAALMTADWNNDDMPTFTRPNGQPLPNAQLQALYGLVGLFELLFVFGFQIVGPFLFFLL